MRQVKGNIALFLPCHGLQIPSCHHYYLSPYAAAIGCAKQEAAVACQCFAQRQDIYASCHLPVSDTGNLPVFFAGTLSIC